MSGNFVFDYFLEELIFLNFCFFLPFLLGLSLFELLRLLLLPILVVQLRDSEGFAFLSLVLLE